MLQLKQKSDTWIMDLVAKLFLPGDVLKHFCAETMAEAKACRLLSEHQHFKRCEMNLSCKKEALLVSVMVLAQEELRS